MITRDRAEHSSTVISGDFDPLAGFNAQTGTFDPDITNKLDDRLSESYRTNEELIQSIKQSHPDLNIKTDSEIEQEVIQDQLDLLDRDKDLQERSTFLGKVGYLTGSLVGWIRDPTHAASLLAGGSITRGASMLTNFLRVGAAEAAIEAAIVTGEKGAEVEFRRSTGEEVSATQAILEAGVEVGLAGVLGGTVGAVGGFIAKAIPKAKNPTNAASEASAELLDKFNKSAKNPTAEQVQAAALLDETVRIAKRAPKDANYEQHMTDYAHARKSIVEGRDINKADAGVDSTKVEPPESSRLADTEVTPDEADILIKDVKDSLEVEDVTFRELNKDNQVISEKSARGVMNDLDAQDKALRDTITCFNVSK